MQISYVLGGEAALDRLQLTAAFTTDRSVARNCRVDLEGPGVDAAGDRLRLVEALLAEPVSHRKAARAVVAEDEQVVFRVEFLVGSPGELAHGDEGAAGDAGGGELPEFADVDEANGGLGFRGFAARGEKLGGGGCCDLVIHAFRIIAGDCLGPDNFLPGTG